MDRKHRLLQGRQINRSNRWDCLLHYSPRARVEEDQPACSDCGIQESRCLLIDHKADDGGEHRRKIGRSSTSLYHFLISHRFPSGYQTLCANCSAIKEHVRRRKNLKKFGVDEEFDAPEEKDDK